MSVEQFTKCCPRCKGEKKAKRLKRSAIGWVEKLEGCALCNGVGSLNHATAKLVVGWAPELVG